MNDGDIFRYTLEKVVTRVVPGKIKFVAQVRYFFICSDGLTRDCGNSVALHLQPQSCAKPSI